MTLGSHTKNPRIPIQRTLELPWHVLEWINRFTSTSYVFSAIIPPTTGHWCFHRVPWSFKQELSEEDPRENIAEKSPPLKTILTQE